MTIELATSLILLISTFSGPATTTTTDNYEIKEVYKPKNEISVTGPATLEDHIRDYFKDDPILAEIAKCESRYTHFDKNGKVMRGVNPDDVGVMQINEKFHIKQSEKLGFDIHTLEGNMAYAKWLYEKEGVKPWKYSSKCWSEMENKIALTDGKEIKGN